MIEFMRDFDSSGPPIFGLLCVDMHTVRAAAFTSLLSLESSCLIFLWSLLIEYQMRQGETRVR